VIPAPSFPFLALAEPADLPPRVEAVLLALAWPLAFLLLAGLFATLRVSLLRSHAGRVLARTDDQPQRGRIERLLERAERFAISAEILEAACEVVFLVGLYQAIELAGALRLEALLWTVASAVPLRLVLGEALPTAIALRAGDTLLLRVLPAFRLMQLPIEWLVRGLEVVRAAFLRIFGLRGEAPATRAIVEELREVIADSEISGKLDETEKEIIGNVMEFRDVNVAAVMTPRTLISGVELDEGVSAAARLTADTGHSRLPVYDKSLDTIVGVVSARDVVRVATEKGFDQAQLRAILRPAYFVPETKRVSELLSEFKREKIKLAIVLDEYGGTAGLVTLGDIVQELVGEIEDEHGAAVRASVRRLHDGSAEVDAALHVSEVNAELDLEIPEGDYETLAGFVLSQLGHFPRRGEHFVHGPVEFTVTDANDRRVFKVRVRVSSREAAA